MTRNTFSELHNCGHEAIGNTKLPYFYTLVLNDCQQFTVAEREKYRCENSFKSRPHRMCKVLGAFLQS